MSSDKQAIHCTMNSIVVGIFSVIACLFNLMFHLEFVFEKDLKFYEEFLMNCLHFFIGDRRLSKMSDPQNVNKNMLKRFKFLYVFKKLFEFYQ